MIRFILTISRVVIMTILFACSSTKSESVKRVSVLTKMPIEVINGKPVISEIEFYISYYKGCMVYELPYHKTHEVNGKLMYDSVRYELFVFRTGEESGYLLKSIKDSFSISINCDSILMLRAYGGTWDMADVFKEIKVKGKHEEQLDQQKKRIRYYFDHCYYDSAHLYYDNELSGISFSFSKYLDSVSHSKLVKALFFIKNEDGTNTRNISNAYVNSFELRVVPLNNESVIKHIVDSYLSVLKKE